MYNELSTAETITHHFVDDAVPAYEAMESFRRHFPLTNPQVSNDGRSMTYQATATRDSRLCTAHAMELIDTLQLPLQPIILDNKVWILYTGK
ncbi:MAG: hypothetical protein J0H07_10445 [Sphingobacteriales bacterium]|nr:hypothetical protein [Sphingobacteriales bacterium]